MTRAISTRHVVAAGLGFGLLLASSPSRADGWQFQLPFGHSHAAAPAGQTEDEVQADYRKQANALINQGN